MKLPATVVRPYCPECRLTFPVAVTYSTGGRTEAGVTLNVHLDSLAVAAHMAQHRPKD